MSETMPESNLVRHAREELQRAGLFDEDSDYGGMVAEAALQMVERFAAQGHSGFSAELTLSVVERLLRFQPLTPLTNDPSEWNDVGRESGSPMWQSRRRPDAFSTDGGRTYYTLDDPSTVVVAEAST